jgi:hypothetical protein
LSAIVIALGIGSQATPQNSGLLAVYAAPVAEGSADGSNPTNAMTLPAALAAPQTIVRLTGGLYPPIASLNAGSGGKRIIATADSIVQGL